MATERAEPLPNGVQLTCSLVVETCCMWAGAAAAAKKWRGLINIHDLDCTMLHARIFERVD